MTEHEMAALAISKWQLVVSAAGILVPSSLIAWGLWTMTRASRNRSREIDELARAFRQQAEASRQQAEASRQQAETQTEMARQQGEMLRQQGEMLRQQGETLRQQGDVLAELLRRTA